ncbi:MAG: 1-acyl-sn-glycerol-3-phosphate acyltransferase [Leptospiraceae bacterium]|nr:MAG: 1-acyl-sn-glycerol-3-phosphate acyltransferase [Leptospiraceae bacterium]
MYEVSFWVKVKVLFQRILGNLSFIIIGIIVILLLKFYFRFKILDHQKHKAFYRNIIKKNKPILICSNHLTMIDSVILQYAFGSYFFYLFHFNAFPWNVPAQEVFAKNVFAKMFLFLVKCIPIDRKGSLEYHEKMLNQIKYILMLKEPFIIFPEGGRSRKGIFDLENITYGVGRIVYDLKDIEVLCVYLRGNKQKSFTNLPEKDSEFYISYKIITPITTEKKRLAAERDLALQIGHTIKQLEEEYFHSLSN